MSTRAVVTLVGVVGAAIVVVLIILLITNSAGHYSDAANRACVGHRGVRQLDDSSNSAVCWDGYVGHVNW